MILVDTSALYALLDREDEGHGAAVDVWEMVAGERLVTHSYVVVETVALAQHRLGMDAVRDLHEAVFPVLDVGWVDEVVHQAAMATLVASGRRGISLVDHVSFEVMRRRGIHRAFAFDADFSAEGFAVLP